MQGLKELCVALALFGLFGCQTKDALQPVTAETRTDDHDREALEKVLWDVNQQWLCAGPYMKTYKDCVEFRSKYWVAQFFEVLPSGEVLNKEEMVATQTSR